MRRDVAAEEVDEHREQHLDHVVDGAERADRGAAVLALAHRHRHLADADAAPDRHHEPLDLGVVARQVGGEERDRAAVERLEARGRVGEPLVGDPRDDAGEHADPDAPRRRRAVARVADEARADREVGLAGGDRSDELAELGRVVLAVAVEPHRQLVAALPGVAEPGLDGAADPEVEREPDHMRPGRGGEPRRCGRSSRPRRRRPRARGRAPSARRAAGRCSAPRCRPARSRCAAPRRGARRPPPARPELGRHGLSRHAP